MERKDYIYYLQDDEYDKFSEIDIFREANKDFEDIYKKIDYKMRQPDLLGKTVMITPRQFPDIYYMVADLADEAEIDMPKLYVYEDFYYGMESYGVEEYWIEISAKTIRDLKTNELKFLLAREIFKIADGVTKVVTLANEQFKVFEERKAYKTAFNKWYRMVNYSADNYGYLACDSIEDAVYAIIKLVLNSVTLSEELDIRAYIEQADKISKLNDKVYNHTKLDESIPYAPHRIKNLLAYAISDRAMNVYRGE